MRGEEWIKLAVGSSQFADRRRERDRVGEKTKRRRTQDARRKKQRVDIGVME